MRSKKRWIAAPKVNNYFIQKYRGIMMSEKPESETRSIRQTNALIRSIVELEMLDHPFWVGGLVTRYFLSDRGHVYFDVTDEDYSINCFLREPIRGTLGFEISNGLEVEVFGTVRVYEQQARVQIEVEKVRLIKRSAFVIEKTIQEQLAKKGLWPPLKKPLPENVRHIGLITSKNSEALHDFRETFYKEGGMANIKPVDVRIQGQQAPRQIADAINRLNREAEVDVIVLARGGGRKMDMAVFNDMLIAEAICRSSIPVLTGIGHQQDETFADQVADVSTITPTAAGTELARSSAKQPHSEVKAHASGNMNITLLGVIIVVVIFAVLIVVILMNNPL
jgi:exodeoxyribonuclease VII large subunit